MEQDRTTGNHQVFMYPSLPFCFFLFFFLLNSSTMGSPLREHQSRCMDSTIALRFSWANSLGVLEEGVKHNSKNAIDR